MSPRQAISVPPFGVGRCYSALLAGRGGRLLDVEPAERLDRLEVLLAALSSGCPARTISPFGIVICSPSNITPNGYFAR
jgi:hypothetical protein